MALARFLLIPTLLCLSTAPALEAQSPGSRKKPVYEQRLVERFDANKNGRVDGTERETAIAWIKAERKKNPPRKRGSLPAPETDLKPRMIDKAKATAFPDKHLYDTSVIRTMFLDFDEPDWAANMALLWRTGIQTRANLTVDGEEYPDVGVHFRGTSSFFTIANRKKKSLGISINWVKRDQRLAGYRSLNLLNGHADPSFLRTILFAHLVGRYIATPKACFVHLVINGESYGLYINDQQINKDFLKEAFDTKKGARWKVRPNFEGKSALAYQGPDRSVYENLYELKSASSKKKAWKGLIQLCETLSERTPEELERQLPALLDIDYTLWYLALDNVLMDGDGYHYRGSDYALFMHPKGRFYPLFRDNNEAFSYGGGPGGFGRPRDGRQRPSLELAPLARADEKRAALCHALLSVPKWRTQYLQNCRTILDDQVDWKKIRTLVEGWKKQIEPLIAKDDKALYGHAAFVEAVGEGSDRKPGLRKFFEERRAFLLGNEQLKNQD